MPTLKQKAVIKRIIENRGNISKSMAEVGYTTATAKNPKNLTESKGFQELMNEQGLTDEFLNDCLVKDIKGKPKKRIEELKLAYKLKGRLSDNQELPDLQVIIADYKALK